MTAIACTQITTNPEAFIQSIQGVLRTTSMKVAEAFGRNHRDVLRKIDSLDCSAEFASAHFCAHEELIQAGAVQRRSRVIEMDKDGFMFLVMGFTGKKAAQVKEAYITAFNWMAEQLSLTPTSVHDRKPLNRAVRTLANLRSAQGEAADYGGMWKLVNGYLGVATIEDATQEQVERAMAFVQDSIERESRRIIEGEWLSKNDTPDLTQDQGLAKCLHTWSRVATHRWKELDQLTAHQDRLIQQQEQMLEEQRDLSNKISAVRANLYDPLMEMSHQLSQLPSDSKADASDVRQAIEMQNRARRH